MSELIKDFEIINAVMEALTRLAKGGYLIFTANILKTSYKLTDNETSQIIDYLQNDKSYIRPIYRCYNIHNPKEYVDFKHWDDIPFGKKVHESKNKLTSFVLNKHNVKTYYFITPTFMHAHKANILA